MMIRVLLLFLVCTSLAVRASDPISTAYTGASATVTQPHVTAELIPETSTFELGKSFDIILHLHSDPGWHTYWINPGDAGLATTIKWTLPGGFTAGPIQWPTPEKHKMGPLVTYGYEGDVYLITTIKGPETLGGTLPPHIEIKANARWLVCQEECIPGKGDFSLTFDTGSLNLRLPIDNKDFFDAARMRLPVPNTVWNLKASYRESVGVPSDPKQGPIPETLYLEFKDKSGTAAVVPGAKYFFPEQSNVLSAQSADTTSPNGSTLAVILQRNGEKPDKLSGVLISDDSLIGDAKAVYLSEFPVTSEVAAAVPSGGSAPPSGGPDNLLSGSPQATGGSQSTTDHATASPMGTSAATSEPPFLITVLGLAFVGGLILNLMPCVLPVLSLKVFSLMKHAGDDPGGAWKQGAAFTAGVVISFWLLAGLLLILKALGNQLGWGFQMQSPGFILGMIFLFFLLSLNLLGVFEFGTSLVGLDVKATGQLHGLTSSFFNGALATLAATPCTGPLMGSTLGFAAQQPAFISMLIFTVLALGMASPYLLLTIFPGALKFVPKPGAWMEAFKQFMGFLMLMAVVWFIEVFGASVGEDRISWLLFALLLMGIAAWIYGRWVAFDRPLFQRALPILFMLVFLGGGVALGVNLAVDPVEKSATTSGMDKGGYLPWSQDAVQKALADGKPVFVDFTAAWCLSCKVNERVALDTDAVRKAFSDKNVMLFKADWTHADPEISKALQQYNRDGVPLYLLYSPKDPTKPQVLPEVLTPGIVLDALGKV